MNTGKWFKLDKTKLIPALYEAIVEVEHPTPADHPIASYYPPDDNTKVSMEEFSKHFFIEDDTVLKCALEAMIYVKLYHDKSH